MARKKKKRKHILKLNDQTVNPGFEIIGIQTKQAIYKLAYDFNLIFSLDFHLQDDLKVIRKNKEVFFENYATSENAIGQKIRLVNNEILVLLSHPNTLFDTSEAYYLFEKLQTLNYVIILPESEGLSYRILQQKFQVNYPFKFIEVDITRCDTAFPVFPV